MQKQNFNFYLDQQNFRQEKGTFVGKPKKNLFLIRIFFWCEIFLGEKFFFLPKIISKQKRNPNKKRASIFTWIKKFRQEKKNFGRQAKKLFFWSEFFFLWCEIFLVRNFFLTWKSFQTKKKIPNKKVFTC